MKKPICFLALLFVLFMSCGEYLRFEQPQPSGFKALNNIPIPLRGTYLKNDSTLLVVSKKMVLEKDTEEVTDPWEEMAKEMSRDLDDDSDLVVSDSSSTGFKIYSKSERIGITVSYPADEQNGYFKYEHEIFRLGKNDVVKKKGDAYYFSVLRPNDNAWVLRKVVLEGDSLFIFRIKRPKEREALEALTGVKDHYNKDGEQKGWMIDPSPDVLPLLFDQYGKRSASYIRMK